jgi:F-type H+-transporting ATPase subunit epsilon
MPLHVQVVTQEGLLFDDADCDMVTAPGSEGEMGILPHHAALLSTLGYGELRIKKHGAEESFAIFGGVIEVRQNRVTVLADTAQSTYQLDEEQAQNARKRAEELMKTGAPEEKRYAAEELRRAGIQENILRKLKQRPAAMRIKSIEDEPSNKN